MKLFFSVIALLCISINAYAVPSSCPHSNFAQNQLPIVAESYDQELCYTNFTILYNYKYKIPVAVGEYLSRDNLLSSQNISRDNNFHVEMNVPAAAQALPSDYNNTGYDRGHQAPAGDMPSVSSKHDSFVMSNMVPQKPWLNRVTWRLIEEEVRDRVINTNITAYVITGVIVRGYPDTITGGIQIPKYNWKAVNYSDGVKVVYVVDNTLRSNITPSRITLSETNFKIDFGFNPFATE